MLNQNKMKAEQMYKTKRNREYVSIRGTEEVSDYIQNAVIELSKEYLSIPYGSKCSCKSCRSCGGGCYGCKGACGCKSCKSLVEKLGFLKKE